VTTETPSGNSKHLRPGELPASTDITEHAATQGAWNELVRRARINREIKTALMMIGSYANADGTNVFCGVARLAADCDVSYRTAGRYFAFARNSGLIHLVKPGNRRRGQADLYRLILDPKLLEHIELPSPQEYREYIGKLAAANRASSKKRQSKTVEPDDSSSTDTLDDRRNESDLRTHGDRRNNGSDAASTDSSVSVGTRFYGHQATVSTDTPDVLPPPIAHLTSTTDLSWEPTNLRNARQPSTRARVGNGENFATRMSRTPGPTCGTCGTELEPDGGCFTCHIPAQRDVSVDRDAANVGQ